MKLTFKEFGLLIRICVSIGICLGAYLLVVFITWDFNVHSWPLQWRLATVFLAIAGNIYFLTNDR